MSTYMLKCATVGYRDADASKKLRGKNNLVNILAKNRPKVGKTKEVGSKIIT